MSQNHTLRYIGTMSGTSLDGLDVVLTEITSNTLSVVAAHTYPYPPSLSEQLLSLCSPGENEIEHMLVADIELARFTAQSINSLLQQQGLMARDIRAIGHHGQTIRHLPDTHHPNTLQIGDANTVAQLTGITTVADLRRRDMAAGGQGAPLVPAFHQAQFSRPGEDRVVVNIGGIANITVLDHSLGKVIGFDSGPGNVLMDFWFRQHHTGNIDTGGEWAESGKVDLPLLQAMLEDDYFYRPYPKSTGREYFHQTWLEEKLGGRELAAEDVQATLCQLTVDSILMAIGQTEAHCQRILVCGGGSHNLSLMRRLADGAGCPVEATGAHGIDADWVEGACFAWLAQQCLEGRPGNLPSVTGASQEVILGAIYQA